MGHLHFDKPVNPIVEEEVGVGHRFDFGWDF